MQHSDSQMQNTGSVVLMGVAPCFVFLTHKTWTASDLEK